MSGRMACERYGCAVTDTLEQGKRPEFGPLLRQWRARRRRSQLDLALETGVSARHLSFLETGRAKPSREMVLRLAEQLNVPLEDRNALLLAAGYAPAYPRRSLDHEEMAAVRAALDHLLHAYLPYPALVVDRTWTLLTANAAAGLLMSGVSPALLEPPVNVLRVSLHPEGLAPAIRNLAQWRGHVLHRLAREIAATGDPALVALRDELAGYPGGESDVEETGVAIPLRLRVRDHDISLLSTITTFGTALDLTLAELSLEAFLPADGESAQALAALVDDVTSEVGLRNQPSRR